MNSHTPPKNLAQLRAMKIQNEKIACLTAYDASFAALCAATGVDALLVGDSLGMVIQGQNSTLPVTLEDMIYHARAVRRGAPHSLVIVDMPFMTYATSSDALHNAARLMRESGAQMVKLEGGAWLQESIQQLVERGIPVCAHLGLTPQSVHQLGGYRVQGRAPEQAEKILADALAVQAAGASLLVLECVPAQLAKDITQAVSIPTIGIGAGVACDGQVLVLYDMLGITPGKKPAFSQDFMSEQTSVAAALSAYVQAVKQEKFPHAEHSF